MFRVWLAALLVILGSSQAMAARRPDDKSKADYVVSGTVEKIYWRKSGRLTEYIVQLRLDDVFKGDGYQKGESLYVYCYQRSRELIPLPDDLGHTSIPQENEVIKAYVHRRHGVFEANFPDWFEPVQPAKP